MSLFRVVHGIWSSIVFGHPNMLCSRSCQSLQESQHEISISLPFRYQFRACSTLNVVVETRGVSNICDEQLALLSMQRDVVYCCCMCTKRIASNYKLQNQNPLIFSSTPKYAISESYSMYVIIIMSSFLCCVSSTNLR